MFVAAAQGSGEAAQLVSNLPANRRAGSS